MKNLKLKRLEEFHAAVENLGALPDIEFKLKIYEQDQKELQRVAVGSVKALVDNYLHLLRELNQKDKPIGFNSWEAYHKHIRNLQKENNNLKKKYEN